MPETARKGPEPPPLSAWEDDPITYDDHESRPPAWDPTPLTEGALPAMMYDRTQEEAGRHGAKILARYLELKAEMSELEIQMSDLKDQVRDVLMEEDGEKVQGFLGHDFTLQQRVGYEYSDDLKGLEERVKGLKKEEEKNGTAKKVPGAVFPVVKPSRKP